MITFIRPRLALTVLAVLCLASPLFAQPQPLAKVVVALDRQGGYCLDGKRVSRAQIEPLLAARARRNPDLVAILRCDRNVQYGRVVELNELVTAAGVRSVMFAAPAAVGMPHRRRSAGHFRGTRT